MFKFVSIKIKPTVRTFSSMNPIKNVMVIQCLDGKYFIKPLVVVN